MGSTWLFVHSSDELYGSDRMLLEFLDALPDPQRRDALVWLPTDVPHGRYTLCSELAARGIRSEHCDLPILRRSYLTPHGLAATARRLVAMRPQVAAVDPAVVVLATSAALPMALGLGSGPRPEVVLHLQEVWEGRHRQILGLLGRRAQRIIAISDAARASLPTGLRARTTVVPNTTGDPGQWTPVPESEAPLTFLVASRWMPWKGHEVLLRAWDAAGSPGRLVILGGPPATGAATDVRALADAAARPETIEVVGEVADPEPHLARADVMVVPSVRDEPFGLVTIEAFARGRPVIGSANGGLRETIADGAGWLFPPGDHEALAHLLASLTRNEVVRAGGRARRRYEDRYSTEAFRTGLRAALGLPEAPRGDTS